jgi:hypothetical protein
MADNKAYEIRQSLLHLAEEILKNNAHMRFVASGEKEWKGYTTEDIIKEAKKLNAFVSNKG